MHDYSTVPNKRPHALKFFEKNSDPLFLPPHENFIMSSDKSR